MLTLSPTAAQQKKGKFVRGAMQTTQLMIYHLLEHSSLYHGESEVISRLPETPSSLHRTNYSAIHTRCKQLANVLEKEFGMVRGDVIGTLAFNTYRHLEVYYSVSCIGGILHTVNPRLFLEQIEYIINHGEDELLFVDVATFDIMLKLIDRKQLTRTKKFIVMTCEKYMPKMSAQLASTLAAAGLKIYCYETLLSKYSSDYTWQEFDENTAASLCYTSGTTGNPKGVLYSHRSTILHTYGCVSADQLAVHAQDTILAIVPLFHAAGWGMPYVACMTGCRLVLPGPQLDGKSVYDLIMSERVTFSCAVPTVFLTLLAYMDEIKATSLGSLNRIAIGGAAPPRAMIKRMMLDYGIAVLQVWGMTEVSPLGTINGQRLLKHSSLTPDQQVDLACKAGRVIFGVRLKLQDDDGREVPFDGKQSGELLVAGPWITNQYHRLGVPNIESNGYFKTGDIVTIDQDGYLTITDRSKDVIKSGGEWISSIDMENEAMNHSAVQEAACIGVKHHKFTERPLLVVVLKNNQSCTEKDLLEFLAKRVAKYQVPEAVEFVKELPHTATGKLKKTDLRKIYENYVWRNPAGNPPVKTNIQAKL